MIVLLNLSIYKVEYSGQLDYNDVSGELNFQKSVNCNTENNKFHAPEGAGMQCHSLSLYCLIYS